MFKSGIYILVLVNVDLGVLKKVIWIVVLWVIDLGESFFVFMFFSF